MSDQASGAMPLSQLPILGIVAEEADNGLLFSEALRVRLEGEGFTTVVLRMEHPVTDQKLQSLYVNSLQYDAVLVVGNRPLPFTMAVCSDVPWRHEASYRRYIHRLFEPGGPGREELEQVTRWFVEQWLSMPVQGCILVGGKSSRMGTAKHLIRDQGATWAERTVGTLRSQVEEVVVSGAGRLPESLHLLDRVGDVDGLAGPIAGILSIMRYRPMVSWLVAACDLPDMNEDALRWILSHRKPGIRGILPDLEGNGRVEPLLAYYDFRCLPAMEELVESGSMRINRISSCPGVISPTPPASLKGCWRNVNTLRELMAKR